MSAIPRALVGKSGRQYLVGRLLQDRPVPLGRVYFASADYQHYVLKNVMEKDFESFKNRVSDVRQSRFAPYVRLPSDSIPDKSMFVYPYRSDDLLSFATKTLPLSLRKRILRDSLRGIVALHEKGIVHTDIKPNNIMLDWTEEDGNIAVQNVQIADIEDAIYVPDRCDVTGRQFGNWMWRSPEAHASGHCNKPTDIYSFAIVCIYALTKNVIFAVDDDELDEGVDKLSIVLERQISYFGDLDGYYGLVKHLGKENPWVQIFAIVMTGFGRGEGEVMREPFWGWTGAEKIGMSEAELVVLKDLIGKMTSLDPKKRITAQEALEHEWFAAVEDDVSGELVCEEGERGLQLA